MIDIGWATRGLVRKHIPWLVVYWLIDSADKTYQTTTILYQEWVNASAGWSFYSLTLIHLLISWCNWQVQQPPQLSPFRAPRFGLTLLSAFACSNSSYSPPYLLRSEASKAEATAVIATLTVGCANITWDWVAISVFVFSATFEAPP